MKMFNIRLNSLFLPVYTMHVCFFYDKLLIFFPFLLVSVTRKQLSMPSSLFLRSRPFWRSSLMVWWCTRTRTCATVGTCWISSLLSLGKFPLFRHLWCTEMNESPAAGGLCVSSPEQRPLLRLGSLSFGLWICTRSSVWQMQFTELLREAVGVEVKVA